MAEDFSRHIARIASAQIAEAAGYDAVQESAIEILSQLLIRYIGEISASSHSYAQLAGRTDVNIVDISLALDDVSISFADLAQYIKSKEPVPFARTLPVYPVAKPAPCPPSFASRGEEPPPHIPAFLPAWPDKHAYVRTPTFAGHEEDPQKQQQELERVQREGEDSVVQLHARIARGMDTGQEAEVVTGSQQPADMDVEGISQPAMPSTSAPQDDTQAAGGVGHADAASRVFRPVLPVETEAVRERGPLGRPSSSSWLGWRNEEQMQEEDGAGAMLEAPLALQGSALDWPTATHQAALKFSFHRLPDAYQEGPEEKGTVQKLTTSRRKPKFNVAGDPSKERAKALLAAGAHAMEKFFDDAE